MSDIKRKRPNDEKYATGIRYKPTNSIAMIARVSVVQYLVYSSRVLHIHIRVHCCVFQNPDLIPLIGF